MTAVAPAYAALPSESPFRLVEFRLRALSRHIRRGSPVISGRARRRNPGGGIRREGKNQIFSIIDKLQGRDYFIYPEPGRRGFQGKGGIKGLMAAPGSTDLRSKASASLLFS